MDKKYKLFLNKKMVTIGELLRYKRNKTLRDELLLENNLNNFMIVTGPPLHHTTLWMINFL